MANPARPACYGTYGNATCGVLVTPACGEPYIDYCPACSARWRNMIAEGQAFECGPTQAKTLAQRVDELACRATGLDGLAGEMLATIKLNVERGHIIATSDDGKLQLAKCIAAWEKQLDRLTKDA